MGYVLRGGEEGAERLRLLARVVGPTTEALLSRVGVADGMRCLDVGCGLGAVTRELAHRVGPAGQAVGVDLDERILELARQEAAQQSLAVVFRAGSVLEVVGGPAYDLVYARFLLTHLAQPGEAVRRLAAATGPGGVVMVEDTDFAGHFCYPACPAFDRYVALYTEVVQQRGGDACLGPRLPELLEGAGLGEVEVQVALPAFRRGEGKRLAAVTLTHVREAVVAAGLATAPEVDGLVAALEAFAADPRTIVSLPRIFQVWGRKAGADRPARGGHTLEQPMKFRSDTAGEDGMRFDLRLHGRTASGQPCRANVTVHASSPRDLQEQARRASETAAWVAQDPPHYPIHEGSAITVERIGRI